MEHGIVIDACSEIQELSSKNGVREPACYQGVEGSQIVRCPDPLADGSQVGTLSRSQIFCKEKSSQVMGYWAKWQEMTQKRRSRASNKYHPIS